MEVEDRMRKERESKAMEKSKMEAKKAKDKKQQERRTSSDLRSKVVAPTLMSLIPMEEEEAEMDPFKDPYFLMPVEDPHDTNVRCAPVLPTLLLLLPPPPPYSSCVAMLLLDIR